MAENEGTRPQEGTASRVTPADVTRAMWRHIITLQWSWNYERMQGLGWLWSMLPIISKVHPDPEDLKIAMRRNINFYNTNPQVGSPAIFGAAVAMEQQGEPDVADSLKVGLMGPFAGIGDTVQGILYRPIIAVFAASLGMAGSILGALLMVLSGVFWVVTMPWQFRLGYRQGMNLVQEVSGGGRIQRLTETATVMGLVVIGGFIPSILSGVKSPLKFARAVNVQGQVTQKVVELQTILDQILPFAIPVLLVGLAYWLIRSRKWSPVWVLLLLTAIGFAATAVHVL